MQMAYNLTDLFWLGRVGSDAVAAAGAAGMYLWLSFGFLLIGRMGAEITVAQSLGRGDKKAALIFSQNSMLIALVLGTLFGLAMVLCNRQLIGFFGFKESHVAQMGMDYLFFTGIPMPLAFTASVAVGSFNASGNSRTPFIINSLGLAANVLLDPVFIFVLGMGVKGAAIATLIAQSVSCSALLIALFISKHRPFERYSFRFRPDVNRILRLLKLSLPIGMESILFCFLSMICARIEAGFGAHAVAVAKIGSQMESLSWLIGGGFGSALVAFIGQNHGAGKRDRIAQGVKISFLTMTVWGSLVTLFLFTLGPVFFRILLPAPELASLGRSYLYIFAFCQLPMNLEAVGAGAFKGTSRTIQPSLVSIVSNIAKPILAWFLSRTSLGIFGVWISVSICSFIRGIWICAWYFLAEKKS
jgi:putative MATE family efflux protein